VEENGQPYSDAMDEIMYGKLPADEHKRMTFSLDSLTHKAHSGESAPPFQYEATGILCVAGETNTVTMPVSVSATAEGQLQFSGSLSHLPHPRSAEYARRAKANSYQISPTRFTRGPAAATSPSRVDSLRS